MYTPIPVSTRTAALRELYLTFPVPREKNPYVKGSYSMFGTGDRWMTLGFLHGWRDHIDAPTSRLRYSYGEAQELYESQPQIYDGELIAGNLWLPDMTPEEQEEYDALLKTMDASPLVPRGMKARKTHLGMDFPKLLKVGIDGLLREIDEAESRLDDREPYPNFEAVRAREFYECCRIELLAEKDLARRYAEKAEEMAAQAEGKRKEELVRMAAALHKVPAGPAESFFEAVQSVHFFLSNLFGLFPLCRPDRYLISYYEKDIASGALTRETAQELIDQLCLGISTRVFSRAACGFIVGGIDEKGKLTENDLTWMFLTALDHVRMADPNGALAVCSETGDEILTYSMEIISRGVTHPAFFNDTVIVKGLERYGISHEDAVNYIHTTCAEITAAGRSRGYTTPYTVDLPMTLTALVKDLPDGTAWETLVSDYLDKIRETVIRETRKYLYLILEAGRNGHDPMRASCLVSDCIERGRSIHDDGARYSLIQPILVGFSTAIDSLTALRKLVYTDKRLTLSGFSRIVEENFDGNEELRQEIIREVPHYGNDEPFADETAKYIAEGIKALFREKDIPASEHLVPGTFTYILHASIGEKAGATFDGRKAGYSYSDGCSPVQGRDTHGPTAMICSLTNWDQTDFMAGMVVNVKLGKISLTEEKKRSFLGLVRAFMERGGVEMQFNVVDRATLLDAREHPEDHGDLLVRIGGYSDYFVRLTETLKQEVIDRTEY